MSLIQDVLKDIEEIVENDIELWELARTRLNQYDEDNGEANFMELYEPIKKLKGILDLINGVV